MQQPKNPNLSSGIPAPRAVPTGRSLDQVPKGEPIPAPDGKSKPRNTRQTLRQLITHEETVNEDFVHPYIKMLMEFGTKKAKGPWREYLLFYRNNMSGDTDSFTEKTRLYVEKMCHDIEAAYAKMQKDESE